tara:strand:+ start:475 stop:636 length:162 start_codon:yes stop_codon:yes gene_type:complete
MIEIEIYLALNFYLSQNHVVTAVRKNFIFPKKYQCSVGSGLKASAEIVAQRFP